MPQILPLLDEGINTGDQDVPFHTKSCSYLRQAGISTRSITTLEESRFESSQVSTQPGDQVWGPSNYHAAMSLSRIYITITVFQGDPVDFQKFRHTALFFQFEDGQQHVTIHAIGMPGSFVVEVQE